MTSLRHSDLLESVRQLFTPAADPAARSLGAELEMIPVSTKTGKRILARGPSPSGSELVAAMGRKYNWSEEPMGDDPACWTFADGRVTFEPGGQIEFSSAVFPSAELLIQSLDKWLPRFSACAADLGILLKTVGIEDHVSIDEVPLQLNRDRYRMMTRYFESLGPFGVLMMRQTASLQINVDRGEAPLDRWRLLNALAPYLVAIFANSSRYEGRETGHQSYRAHVWRNLDPRRTGIAYEAGREAEHYLEFALNAPVILGGVGEFPPFRDKLAEGRITLDDWESHLSTLFPEVRLRDYFEIRSIDAVEPRHVSAAIAFIAGLVYDKDSAEAAMAELGEPSSELLVTAGVRGLKDERLRVTSERLSQLSLEGCQTLGPAYISSETLSRAVEFFESHTLKGRAPADS